MSIWLFLRPPLPSLLLSFCLWRHEQSPTLQGQLTIPLLHSPTDHWKHHNFRLTAPPVHFARNPGNLQNSHLFLHQRFSCLPTHDQSRKLCGIDAGMIHFPASGTLTRISVVGPWPSKHSMLVDVQLKKGSYQNALQIVDSEMFVGQSGNLTFSPLLRQLPFSSASSLAHHRLSADFSHCLGDSSNHVM